ncbi:hypothetical protein HIM_03002 [Hirsutella minnesotensis 3608]|nr:hypothetical protein HIM_03002 [Hirsutella minnesotensis 3608]
MERPVEKAGSTKSSGRLRAACDSCHQAKVKCSGTVPCATCQASQLNCVYSPGNRLGRPKGSKNKKTLMLQNGNTAGETRQETKSLGSGKLNADATTRQHDYQQQHLANSDSLSVDLDFENGSDTTCAYIEDGFADGTYGFPSGPSLISLFGSMESTYLDANQNYDFNALFASMGSPNGVPQPVPSHAISSQILPASIVNDYGISTASPFSDNESLSSAQSMAFPCGHTESQGSSPSYDHVRCSCLQRQVELVYQLGELQSCHAGSLAVDRILQGVQLAQGPWKALMRCNTCQSQDSQREAYLLLATSIRILLSAIQTLISSFHQRDDLQGAAKSQQDHRGPGTSCSVLVGSYELMGEAKAEVLSVAVRGALQKIVPALLHLWERAGRPGKSTKSDVGGFKRSRSDSKNPPFQSFGNMAHMAGDSQESWHSGCPLSLNASAADVGSLLETLQSTMRAIKGGV